MCLPQPAQLTRRDVELEQPVRDVGVVVEVAGAARPAVAPASPQPTGVIRERAEQELAEPPGRVDPLRPVEPPPGFRERRERKPVPGRDRLVVAQRLRTLVADRQQPRACLLVDLAADDRAAVLEGREQLGRCALLLGPGERQPLDAVRVRVLRRGEAALREEQLAQHVLDRLGGDLAVPLLAGDEPSVQVRRGEQGVVVEHLLEVRHEPAVVDRVAVEAAAEQVVHAAGRHLVEGLRGPCRAPRAGAGTRARARSGTSAPGPSRRRPARTSPRGSAPRRRGSSRSAGRSRAAAPPNGAPLPPAGSRRARRRHAGRAKPRRSSRAAGGSSAGRASARAGSRCRRRTAPRPASGRRSSASRRGRRAPRPPPCRPRRGRGAPRDRP